MIEIKGRFSKTQTIQGSVAKPIEIQGRYPFVTAQTIPGGMNTPIELQGERKATQTITGKLVKPPLVGYSYNGSIPLLFDSYDPKKYPYAIIWGFGGISNCTFFAFTEPVVWRRDNNYGPGECDYIKQEYFANKMYKQEQKHGSADWGIQYILWTNTDIEDTDGNVVLAATEPVPVYE